MKKYTIHYNYYAVADVEVLANSEEEAIEKAKEADVPREEFDFTLNEEAIIDSEDTEDLNFLIEQAEAIIKKADEEDMAVILNPWPRVTIESWTGETMEHNLELMDNIFWNYEY